MTDAERDALVEEIKTFLARGLRGHIGAPLNEEQRKQFEHVLMNAVEKIGSNSTPVELKDYNDLATELLASQFMGIPEDFDPHARLRALQTPFVVMLQDSFSHVQGYPLNIIWLELLYRTDKLVGDWSFTRISGTEASLEFKLKNPPDVVALNLTITEEKKN